MKDYGSFRRHIWAVPFEIAMLLGAILMYLAHDSLHVATSLFTFTVAFAPLLFERIYKIRLPAWLQVTYVIFVFASMFCGEVLRLYSQLGWWDDFMHFVYGLIMGLGVIMGLELVKKREVTLPVWAHLLLVFSIVSIVAMFWEFVEFGSDQLFGTHSQDDSLVDTMLDMIDASVGGVIMVWLYASYLKGKRSVLRPIVTHFLHYNK